jgi:hypothetical protein
MNTIPNIHARNCFFVALLSQAGAHRLSLVGGSVSRRSGSWKVVPAGGGAPFSMYLASQRFTSPWLLQFTGSALSKAPCCNFKIAVRQCRFSAADSQRLTSH